MVLTNFGIGTIWYYMVLSDFGMGTIWYLVVYFLILVFILFGILWYF